MYFKHNRLGSFFQQMRTYGFQRYAGWFGRGWWVAHNVALAPRRMRPSCLDRSLEFFHRFFKQGHPELLAELVRGVLSPHEPAPLALVPSAHLHACPLHLRADKQQAAIIATSGSQTGGSKTSVPLRRSEGGAAAPLGGNGGGYSLAAGNSLAANAAALANHPGYTMVRMQAQTTTDGQLTPDVPGEGPVNCAPGEGWREKPAPVDRTVGSPVAQAAPAAEVPPESCGGAVLTDPSSGPVAEAGSGGAQGSGGSERLRSPATGTLGTPPPSENSEAALLTDLCTLKNLCRGLQLEIRKMTSIHHLQLEHLLRTLEEQANEFLDAYDEEYGNPAPTQDAWQDGRVPSQQPPPQPQPGEVPACPLPFPPLAELGGGAGQPRTEGQRLSVT